MAIRFKDEAPAAVVQKKRTASPSKAVAVSGGKGPPEKPPLSAAAAGKPVARGGEGLAPPFLTQVDYDTLVWLEEQRKVRGLRSRSETIRAVLSEARGK